MIEGEAGIPPAMIFQLDWRTLAFTSAVSVVTVVFFALIPAIRSTKTDANPALKKDSRSIAGGGMASIESSKKFLKVAGEGECEIREMMDAPPE